jgi:2,4-dienoyl-CoA reductase-like NADH-dependent reductase (Old Yellow Enzyme family)
MASLGFSHASGNEILVKGNADLVSFGTPFVANPDLVERFQGYSARGTGHEHFLLRRRSRLYGLPGRYDIVIDIYLIA